jgi:hypothetical protein
MRVTNFTKLAAAKPVDRKAAGVAATAPADGRPWSGIILDLQEQLAVAEGEVQRLGKQLEAVGYPTPLWTRRDEDRRHRLVRRLEHYEAVAHDLRHELRRANGVTHPKAKPPKRWAAEAAMAAPASPPARPRGPEGALQAALRKAGLAPEAQPRKETQ